MTNHHRRVAAVTYFIFFLPRLLGERDDSFLRYHARQAMGLLIIALALQGAMTIINYWIYSPGLAFMMVWVIRIFLVYELAMGVQSALAGQEKPLPFIGKYPGRIF